MSFLCLANCLLVTWVPLDKIRSGFYLSRGFTCIQVSIPRTYVSLKCLIKINCPNICDFTTCISNFMLITSLDIISIFICFNFVNVTPFLNMAYLKKKTVLWPLINTLLLWSSYPHYKAKCKEMKTWKSLLYLSHERSHVYRSSRFRIKCTESNWKMFQGFYTNVKTLLLTKKFFYCFKYENRAFKGIMKR